MTNLIKFRHKIMLISLTSLVLYSCYDDIDDNGAFASEINDFVWKGMNLAYLYKNKIDIYQIIGFLLIVIMVII